MKLLKEYLKEIIKEKLNEAKSSNKLVVVDVQPHDINKHIHWNLKEFAEFINSYNNILILFNGEDFGWESKTEMIDEYNNWGIDINKCKFFEKGYAFFRDLIDYDHFDDIEFIQLIKYMYQNNITDIREIEEEEYVKLKISKYIEYNNIDNYPIYIPDELIEQLKIFGNNIDICGGGKNECLLEIEYLYKLLNFKYNRINKYIY